MCFGQDLTIPGVSNLASVWHHSEAKNNEGSRIVDITEKAGHRHQHAQNMILGLFAPAR